MVALTKVGSKIIGPLSPKEFSDLSTLETTIDTAIQAVSYSSGKRCECKQRSARYRMHYGVRKHVYRCPLPTRLR
jgi:hypothetical protein